MTALPVVRRPEADCPFCGKAEGDSCPACHGVNAVEGLTKSDAPGSNPSAQGTGETPRLRM